MSKTQSHQSYDAGMKIILAILGVPNRMLLVGVNKALSCSRLLLVIKYRISDFSIGVLRAIPSSLVVWVDLGG